MQEIKFAIMRAHNAKSYMFIRLFYKIYSADYIKEKGKKTKEFYLYNRENP